MCITCGWGQACCPRSALGECGERVYPHLHRPYYNFFLDWDAYYNNEPHYASFRGQDLTNLCAAAGFSADNYVLWPIPNYTTVDEDYFNACARGEAEAPPHGNGSCWYLFGAWK